MRRLGVIVTTLLATTTLGVGCLEIPRAPVIVETPRAPQSRPPVPTPTVGPEESVASEWKELEPGLNRLEFTTTSTATKIILFRFASDRFVWRFEHATPSKSIAAWQKSLELPTAVANGVYFREDDLPAGLLETKDDGIVGPYRFDDDKSGLIVLNGGPLLIDRSKKGDDREHVPNSVPDMAQSYPFLVLSGRAAVTSDSGLTARRTFIATDVHGNDYLGIVPFGGITLYQLSHALADPQLGLNRALNLDGGPSSGIAIHSGSGLEVENSFTAVPNVVVVTRRAMSDER